MALIACAECKRFFRREERCPFCNADAPAIGDVVLPRMSRGALVAIAALATGCQPEPRVMPYGAPAIFRDAEPEPAATDAGAATPDASPIAPTTPDAGPPIPVAPMYGGPPLMKKP